MNMSNATKYTARDSATAALRKIGVTKSDYDDFIVRRDGIFYCDIEGAKTFIAKQSTKAAAVTERVAAPVVKTEKTVAVKSEGKVSVSALIRTAILEGASNQEIWDRFGPSGNGMLAENHKHYGSWYRCELRRKGHNV